MIAYENADVYLRIRARDQPPQRGCPYTNTSADGSGLSFEHCEHDTIGEELTGWLLGVSRQSGG
jgi:hypothetical protein